MATKKTIGGARTGSGRKPLLAGAVTVPVMIKMTEPQKEKLQLLGGAPWVRSKIDKAKLPKE